MNSSNSVKPEPIQAQANWSYQAYFLAQRQLQVGQETPNISPKINEVKQAVEVQQRQQVIDKMQDLAASIGVHITIISPPE